MKPHMKKNAAPRRLLLQETANASRAPATNSTTGKATAILPPTPPHAPKHHPSAYDVPSPDASSNTDTVRFDSSSVAVTALVILSALFFLGFFSVYARRFFAPDWDNPDPSSRRRRLARRGRIPTVGRSAYPNAAPRGLDPDTIKALPLVRYSVPAAELQAKKAKDRKGDKGCEEKVDEEDHRCCAVCLGEFEDGEELRAIPRCGHAFHRECIDAWLSAHGSCPLCRSTDLFGAAAKPDPAGAPQRRCEACQLETVVVVPAAIGEGAAGQREGGGGQRRFEGDDGRPAESAAAAATVVSPEPRGLGGVGRSRSWLCMSAAAAQEEADEEKGPPGAGAAGREEQPPRRSCS